MNAKKSMSINAILYGTRNLLAIVFPLISFPYVSKVLQVDNLGKYHFAYSVVSYFILIAALGISTYAIREGSKCRGDRAQISSFASEMFSINVCSSLAAYALMGIVVFIIPKMHSYSVLIFIFSLEIMFKTIGTEWIYSIYEDYAYITKRSIVFQCLSLMLLFLFVREENDYYAYAGITVFANAGSNLINYIHAKKICRIRFTCHIDWKKHIKPILLIFATTIATTIYTSSDLTILGFMTDDYHVGLYSVSAKIYKIIKTLLASMLIVSIPRLSNYLGERKTDKYNETAQRIFDTLLTVVTPAAVGLFMVSRHVIILISDITYIEANISLKILSVTIMFCLFGWFYNSCVLIPNKREDKVLISTVVSALLNLGLNFLLVPLFDQNAAAFTTLIAEASAMLICIYFSRGIINIHINKRNLTSVIWGCIAIIAICGIVEKQGLGNVLYFIVAIVLSVSVYGITLLLLRNSVVIDLMDTLRNRYLSKRK